MTLVHRLPPLIIALACAAPLVVGSLLSASPTGTGTHTQIGLPPCGFLAKTGLPCATCGMTTAFTHTAHGDFVAAFLVQPAGAILALLCAMGVIICGYAAATGADLAPLGRAVWRPRTILTLAAVVLLGWVYLIVVTLGSQA